MSPSEEADILIADWLNDKRGNVIIALGNYKPVWSRAILAQFMLCLMDQDSESLPVFIELLEDELPSY